jgi:hypothetical protein
VFNTEIADQLRWESEMAPQIWTAIVAAGNHRLKPDAQILKLIAAVEDGVGLACARGPTSVEPFEVRRRHLSVLPAS